VSLPGGESVQSWAESNSESDDTSSPTRTLLAPFIVCTEGQAGLFSQCSL
jgi:hypothetical protein